MGIEKLLFVGRKLFDGHSLRKRVKKISYKGKKEGVIVFNTVGCAFADVDAEHYIAYLLAREGFKVKILMDDFQMQHWDYILPEKSLEDYKFHRSFKNRFLRGGYGLLSNVIFRHPRIEIINYSKILAEVKEAVVLNQADRNHAESSVRKYFQSGGMDLTNSDHQKFYRETLKNVEISKRAAIYIDRVLKPDLFFTSHGFYSAWGPAKDYLKEKGYRIVVYYPCGYQTKSIMMFENPAFALTEDASWKEFSKKPLTPEEIAKVDGYFAMRLQGKSLDNNLYYQGFKEHKAIAIEKKQAKFTYGLFPNIIWDGDIVERNTIYPGPVDWIIDTISFFETHPENHLVLRFHPAEATFHTKSRKLESIVRQKIPHLDSIKNITVVSSSEKIKTYDLIRDHTDIVLVYDGMVGLESVYIGKPVILTARGRMLGAGAAVEPTTRDEYRYFLNHPKICLEKFDKEKHRENAYKFSAWFLFEQCFSLPILSDKFAQVQFRPDPKEIDPSFDPNIMRTINFFNSRISTKL